jgi:DNA-binding CsgD family transcriptional regulator
MSVHVPIDDVRALFKLAGEVHEITGTGGCAVGHVLAGLSRIVGAEVGVHCLVQRLCSSTPPTVAAYSDHGWSEGERRRMLDYYLATSGFEDPVLSTLARARGPETHVTVRRSDVVTSRAWYASTLHHELHRPGGLDDVVISVHRLAGEGLNALVLKRAAGATPFSVEQRELLHLFWSEFDWVFRTESGPPKGVVDGLTPREQETRSLLLTDASEKEIAARLGLSPHTVHEYVKRLYKKLGVSSRAALMAASQACATSRKP